VRPRVLPPEHPLARVHGAGNAALIAGPRGVLRLAGTGAGRWPAAQAVLADLLTLGRAAAARRGDGTPGRARPERTEPALAAPALPCRTG
jgi:hypothetical protein